jgi:hypothetical protein
MGPRPKRLDANAAIRGTVQPIHGHGQIISAFPAFPAVSIQGIHLKMAARYRVKDGYALSRLRGLRPPDGQAREGGSAFLVSAGSVQEGSQPTASAGMP